MTTPPPERDAADITGTAAEAGTAAASQVTDPAGGVAATAEDATSAPVAESGLPESAAPESGPAESAAAPADPVSLLVQAVGQLPADQRDLVLTWLLRQRPGLSRQWTIGARASEHAAELHALQLSAAGQPGRGMPPAAQQVVPVRFPAQQHAQLREWCAEHGFSMATVIRGLVARFLESQLPDRN